MIPRSKQPNEFNAFFDPDEESEQAAQDSASAWEDDAELQSLLDRADNHGSGAGKWVTSEGRCSPADFSAEDLALARELNSLYSLEREELPPLFVQTLAGDAQDWLAPSGLVQRVTYQVFRRLHLPRRLFHEDPKRSKPRGSQSFKRLPRTVGLSTVLALLLLSLITVAPSFAQGLQLLLKNTGVQVVSRYPQQVATNLVLTQYLSLREEAEAVPFQSYWLGENLRDYHYQSLLLHIGQPWSNGPVVEVQYRLRESAGTGLLRVREFRPVQGSTVLLVVAEGAAHFVQVGSQQAIYIDGRWVRYHGNLTWESGTQAELLYQTGGLVFWITADQRDGASPESLERVAASLEQLYLGMPKSNFPELPLPPRAQTAAALAEAPVGEVVQLDPAGGSPQTGATVYVAVGEPPDDGA